ncbi:hypothetical protein F4778DRAFT_785927 [Xylariomycetidae sp. FL2044]|nr:hypothetical protein F4778DRAFT_785927 [Xylariomycetidae sp. FL2044]
MFGGYAPQFTEEQVAELEVEANATVQRFLGAAVVLYWHIRTGLMVRRHVLA